MDKSIERPFLALFEGLESPTGKCLSWMEQTYDLGVYPQQGKTLTPKQEEYYKNTLPQAVKARVEGFDEALLMGGRLSPLMEEIEGNLDELPAQEEEERYVINKLLMPFKALADRYNPVAQILQREQAIKEDEGNVAKYEQGAQNELLKKQIRACKERIEKARQQIERYKYISSQYRVLTGRVDDGAKWMQEGTVENYLSTLSSWAANFIDRLDALLLTRGIDLLRLERESGVWMKECREVFDIDYYIGSQELAQKYIDALPKEQGGKPQQEAQVFPKELDTNEGRALIEKAIQKGFITVEDGRYRWESCETLQLCAYFVVKASSALNLNMRYKQEGKWTLFEGFLGIRKNGLKDARSECVKYHTVFKPNGYERIDALFEADMQ